MGSCVDESESLIASARRRWIPISLVLAASLVLEAVFGICAVLFMGGGHGSYGVASVFFPYMMFSTRFFATITGTFVLISSIQFPVYGVLIAWGIARSKAGRVLVWIVAVHSIAALAALFFRGGGFVP